MLGQAHSPTRRLLSFALIAVGVLVAPAVGGASSPSTASLRAQDAQIAAQSRAAVLGVYALDERLARARASLAALQQRVRSLNAERAVLRTQLHVAKHGTRIAQRRLATRLELLYEQGPVDPVEVVLGARSLDDAMAGLDNLSRVSSQDKDVLRELEAARGRLTSASRQLDARQARLLAATRAAEALTAGLERTRAERTAFIASLAVKRRLTEHQIAAVVARAGAAQAQTASLAPATASDSATAVPTQPVGAPAASVPAVTAASSQPAISTGQTLTVTATGYALDGATATGLPAGWGVVAVDPSVIPLGTHMTIPGYGEAVAADTGVIGAAVDLWFPSVAQANGWGRRVVTIMLH